MDYSFFYLLFYSFILESLTDYSFHSIYYSFYCTYYSHKSNTKSEPKKKPSIMTHHEETYEPSLYINMEL